MNERSGVAIVLGGVALLLVGCGGTPAPAPPAQPAVRAAGAKEITLHVAGMVKRLNIFGDGGPNKVKEALSGLPGVESVVEDREYLDNDRLHVRFDADRLTPEMLLQAVHKQGFTAAIVPENPSPPGPGALNEETPMRSFFQALLAILTLGMISTGCNRNTAPPEARDVTLVVPQMFGASGGPDRVRKALETLPWVEQASIVTDIGPNPEARLVRFNLTDRKAFNEEALRQALRGQRFTEMTVKARPN